MLKIALCGGDEAERIAETIGRCSSQLLAEMTERPSVQARPTTRLDENIAATHHLVISSVGVDSPWSDLSITSVADAERLTEERLVPWAARWSQGRRAPRAQVAVVSEPDSSWALTANRLIARLHAHTTDLGVLRIDHIGSTSVDGLAAKNLIDIQVVVRNDDAALSVAESATAAGFVHVAGQWYGKDRNGGLHPEQVCVDADPGRPVNITIRSAARPVARDALLFRDWLRANPEARQRYFAVKRELSGRQVDEYGDRKEPFISAALDEADRWASLTDWRF